MAQSVTRKAQGRTVTLPTRQSKPRRTAPFAELWGQFVRSIATPPTGDTRHLVRGGAFPFRLSNPGAPLRLAAGRPLPDKLAQRQTWITCSLMRDCRSVKGHSGARFFPHFLP